MRLTYNHPTVKDGIPVFVKDGKPMTWEEGIRQLQSGTRWTASDIAQMAGVSISTVYGWRQGRPPGAAAAGTLYRELQSACE